MSVNFKYNQLKLSQILIYNQLEVGTYFAFYSCNLLIIIIFTFNLRVGYKKLKSFFFQVNNFISVASFK